MARIRSNILYKWKIKEIEEGQKQIQHLHIALPIFNQENNSLEEEEEEETDSVYEEDKENLKLVI